MVNVVQLLSQVINSSQRTRTLVPFLFFFFFFFLFLEYSFSRRNGLEILPTFLPSLDVDDLALHCSSRALGRKPTRDIYFLFLFPPQPSRGRFY